MSHSLLQTFAYATCFVATFWGLNHLSICSNSEII